MKTISSLPSPATLHSNLPIQHPFRSPTSVHPLALGTGSTADSCTVVVVNVAILSNLNLGENYLPTSLFVRKVTRSVKPDVTLPSRSFALTKNLVLANLPHPPPPTGLRRIPVTLPWAFRGFALVDVVSNNQTHTCHWVGKDKRLHPRTTKPRPH